MIQVIECSRCSAKFDAEEGLRITWCGTPLDSQGKATRGGVSHILGLDTDTDAGAAIATYFDRKPGIQNDAHRG